MSDPPPLSEGSPPPTSPRFLVVGCGGIGGIVSAALLHQGAEVMPLTRNGLIADAVEAGGFVTRGESSLGTVPGKAVTSVPKNTPPFDYVILATQPPQVEEAATSVLSHLADDGVMVVLQNGLCELRIAEIAGADRVVGAIVAWGASMVEPGVYDRTSAGGFTVGSLDGHIDERITTLARYFEAVGPVEPTTNLLGARWSKLAINCAISAIGTVGGHRLGVLMRRRFVRRMALEVMSEVTSVAQAEGVELEKVSGTLDLPWLQLTEAERGYKLGSPGLFAKHSLLLAVGTRYRRLRSSMLAAIERGRPPAVDFLNGEVVDRGARLGIPTPVNAALRDGIHAIAQKKKRSSLDTLEQIFRDTRAQAAGAPGSGAPG
jgi:2-dehydropantoate 2-reductase